jgi:PAS domain-containing protein
LQLLRQLRGEPLDAIRDRRQRPPATEPIMRNYIAEPTTPCLKWTPAMVEALVATLPIGLVVLAKDGSLVYANDAARPFWAEAHTAAAPSAFDAIVARALLAREVVRGEAITLESRVAARGSERTAQRHYLVSVTPLYVAPYEVDGLLITIEDITARTKLERFRPMIESLVRL